MGLVYTSLDPTRKEFRLLRIHPRYRSTAANDVFESYPICCDLFVASRDDTCDYQALSYTWGAAADTVPIQVNRCEHRVGRNLYFALEHLREDYDSVVIWIDAVCINQGNVEEKSEQVLHMTEIYSSAKCTVAWLGLSADGSDQFLERCNRIGGDLARRSISDGQTTCRFSDLTVESSLIPRDSAAQQERYEYLEILIMQELEYFFDEAQGDIPGAIAFVAACNKLLNRDYWTRVWIWQEFIVSTNIVIQCGHSKVNFTELRDSLYFLFRMQPKVLKKLGERQVRILENSSPNIAAKILDWLEAEHPDNNNDPDLAEFKNAKKGFDTLVGLIPTPNKKIFGTRRAYQQPRKEGGQDRFSLIQLLAAVVVEGKAEATDSRDYIFAMLGMAKDTRELGLVANYDKSTSDIQVYTKAAHAIIAAGHVDLIALSQHRLDSNKRGIGKTDIPSWVPDWLNPIVRPSGQVPWETKFVASGKTLFEKSPDFERSSFGHLELLGWAIDTIEETSPAWINPDAPSFENRHNIKKYLDEITKLCDKSNAKCCSTSHNIYAPGALDRESAHFSSPVADQEMNGEGLIGRASESCQQAHTGVLSMVNSMTELSTESLNYLEMMRSQRFRRPFLSNSGFVGLAPDKVEKGDLLVIFCGAKFPYFLRRNGDGKHKLLGEAYCHGIMYGQLMDSVGERETFVIQ